MTTLYKSSEVAAHNSRKSCWIVIRNDVYDVTKYLEEHPGGEEPLLESAGLDATTAFDEAGHSSYAKKQLTKFKIGSLAPGERCARMKPQLWVSRGSPVMVYRCEHDEKRRINSSKPSNRSTPNRSSTSRSGSPSVHKCYSNSELTNSNCSKSTASLRNTKSKSMSSLNQPASVATMVSKPAVDKLSYQPDLNVMSTPAPIPIPRVRSIVVPRTRRGARRPPPESGSKLKYALLALAIAIIAGVAYKKYAS